MPNTGAAGPLFSPPEETGQVRHEQSAVPLASRMRPRSFEEFVGQQHIVGPDSVLANPAITSIFIGATELKHVEHIIAATELTLTESARAVCDEVLRQLRPLWFSYGR